MKKHPYDNANTKNVTGKIKFLLAEHIIIFTGLFKVQQIGHSLIKKFRFIKKNPFFCAKCMCNLKYGTKNFRKTSY